MGICVGSGIGTEDASFVRNQEPACENGAISIGELARQFGVSLRTLRFYQAKGLLAPERHGKARQFSPEDCQRLALILQGKRLGFTLTEMRAMLAAWRPGSRNLPISRKQCVEQIKLLERQRGELDSALSELRRIYTAMFNPCAPVLTPCAPVGRGLNEAVKGA